MSNVWKTLSAIDCSKHVEKKGNLSYLSWAWAWQTLMEHYPDATYEYSDPMTLCGETVEVSVAVTVEGITHTMWLPVMDNRNKSIVGPTSRDISDARMRCLVKCIAMFGLGIYLYAGEDLPSAVKDAPVTGNQAAQLKAMLEVTESDVQKFCQVFKCTSVDDMPAVQFERALAMLNKKAQNENS
jgi:hypothetical protein